MNINEDKFQVYDFQKGFDKMNQKYDKIHKERKKEWDEFDDQLEELTKSIKRTAEKVKNSRSVWDEIDDLKAKIDKLNQHHSIKDAHSE